MSDFREALAECELLDLGWKGSPFTFSNNKKVSLGTRARLYRVVANKEWMSVFPCAEVLHGFANSSDHKPIILSLNKADKRTKRGCQKSISSNQCG